MKRDPLDTAQQNININYNFVLKTLIGLFIKTNLFSNL